MSNFVEKTLAEQGFGASWLLHVGPALDNDARRRRRRLAFAIVTSCTAVALGAAAMFLHAQVNDDMILAQPLNAALILALAALAVIGSWVVMLRHDSGLAAPVRAAVEAHFGKLFTADDNTAFGEVILQDLASDRLLDESPHAVLAHYAGTYGDCRIRLIEASAGLRRRPAVDLLVLRVSLPFSATGEIRGDSDIKRLNALIDGDEDFTGFHVDHDQFDRIFKVACTDLGDGVRIVSRGLAETVLQIQHRLASPLDGSKRIDPRVAFQIAGGSLTMIVESPLRRGGGARLGRAGAERLARELVMRFATAPALVDELHGAVDLPPAFKPLPRGEDAQPHISL